MRLKGSLCVLENNKRSCPASLDSNRRLSSHKSSPLGSPTRVNEDASLTSDSEDNATQKQNFRDDCTWIAMKMDRASITNTFTKLYKPTRPHIPEECNLFQDIWFILQDGNIYPVCIPWVKKKKVNQSHYRPGVAQRVPGS